MIKEKKRYTKQLLKDEKDIIKTLVGIHIECLMGIDKIAINNMRSRASEIKYALEQYVLSNK